MASYSGAGGGYADWSSWRGEPGARRKRLAGYLKAANEMRQSYFAEEGSGGYAAGHGGDEAGVQGPGSFPDAAVVRSGNEEMILFPSYARRHVKGRTLPMTANKSGDSENEQEYWDREFKRHQDESAIVDVDVRGWIYTPQRGPISRRQRLFLGLARQMTGLPAPNSRPGDSSQEASPQRSRQEEELIAREAEKIVRKGEQEQKYANRGEFSEKARQEKDNDSLYDSNSRTSSRNTSPDRGRQANLNHRLSQVSLASSAEGDTSSIVPLKRSTTASSTKLSTSEHATANANLLNRLKPFMATPLEDTPITALFYNDKHSRQHTVYTDSSGHFHLRAPLDFIPNAVRVLAAEHLSAHEEVIVTENRGVSLISDIDDTIKHSNILGGAREIFRNAFVRELDGLTIEGVREWYNTLHDMGVKLHYVSNSPWQMYPALTTYFKLAHLPKGSFHLKQYSGYLQGIFEPVAERKKSSLERIMNDFPERKFILIGDSGEADLEVYTDVAVDNPGRVLGVFIRDVTTPPAKTGYFDSSNGSSTGGEGHGKHRREKSTDSLEASKRFSRPDDVQNDDAELKAAIAASLADMETESQTPRSIFPKLPPSDQSGMRNTRPAVPPRHSTGRTATQAQIIASPEEDLIDFSEPSQAYLTPPARSHTDTWTKANGAKPSPSPPPKPQALRNPSENALQRPPTLESASKTPPPRPRKPSSAVNPVAPLTQITPASIQKPQPPPVQTQLPAQPSPLSQMTPQSPGAGQRPPLPVRPKTYGLLPKSVANFSPAAYWHADAATSQPRSGYDTPRSVSTVSTKSSESLRPTNSSALKPAAPAPPPRLRNTTSYSPASSIRQASNRLSGGWDSDSGNLPGSPGEAGMDKKAFLWSQRWARAKAILDRQGVTLRSWRVGSDVADVCVRLAEEGIRESDRESGREGRG